MKALIQYFVARPVVANVLMFGLLLCSVVLWDKIGKEEMPEFEMPWLSATITYPGASAEDVEVFITKPVEEKLKGVSGLDEVFSTSSFGNVVFQIVFEPNTKNLSEKVQEIKDAINAVEFPREVELPTYRQWKSSEKAIMDIGVYLKEADLLDVKSRAKLQKYALALKDRILTLDKVSAVDASGYLIPEIQIKVKPPMLKRYEISMTDVKNQITQQNVRKPIGSMTDKNESEVTLISELIDVESLKEVIVTSSFQGTRVKLSDIAIIENGFQKSNSILKVQGHEGIILNIKKSASADILSTQKEVMHFVEEFNKNNEDSPISIVPMDDESYDVRNRLSLIASNGVFGFILIVVVLFIFLDLRAGIWVAMGIPFSLAFTIVASMALGITVNNMTLAGIIIVLGIVVDDAIIVAENIQRKRSLGVKDAAVVGATEVFPPIIASILTTCAAFVPLYFFSGRFGMFVTAIPAMIFLMLGASCIEAISILPSHMAHPLPFEKKFYQIFKSKGRKEKFIHALEASYEKFIHRVLSFRGVILTVFIILLGTSFYLFKTEMKYVMFPREEAKDFSVRVIGEKGTKRLEMAKVTKQVEEIFLNDQSGIVQNIRTHIGQSRRGGEISENEAYLRVEVLPPDKRTVDLNLLFEKWEKKAQEMDGISKIVFLKSRFGSDSGSALAMEILENDDALRSEVASKLKLELEKFQSLTNVEIEKPITKKEFRLDIKKDEVSRLGINYEELANTLRTYIEGDILYTVITGEEEVDIRFTSSDEKKDNISKILELTVSNNQGYPVPLKNLVKVVEGQKPSNVQRVKFKRTTKIFSDLKPDSLQTPLELASELEKNIFPKVLKGNASTHIEFIGEVLDSRESESDFSLSLFLVLAIIYILLVFLFDSLWTPFLIGAIIPFGIVGVVLAFYAHGMLLYGFFAVIGTLGMIGVVINDSIVLVDVYEGNEYKKDNSKAYILKIISELTTKRLRAVTVTTLTTVAGIFPTAYGIGGYDSMLGEMMLAMGWGLLFGMFITLVLVPCLYSYYLQVKLRRV